MFRRIRQAWARWRASRPTWSVRAVHIQSESDFIVEPSLENNWSYGATAMYALLQLRAALVDDIPGFTSKRQARRYVRQLESMGIPACIYKGSALG